MTCFVSLTTRNRIHLGLSPSATTRDEELARLLRGPADAAHEQASPAS
ncbi:hypothetical protein SAMN04488570_2064 [Nocardioides scoriae]|uniref:Uncharacterized protein n=1 Tax=Nocardioides scoriae TaxID=642780 RepID=A0A1H1SVT2_9ACTN|nr:hypothetical protein [Nocardioides scoriae]SDS52041.1 hypothetical protein SAMN04488570_2064 [Nocardioides scoriae]